MFPVVGVACNRIGDVKDVPELPSAPTGAGLCTLREQPLPLTQLPPVVDAPAQDVLAAGLHRTCVLAPHRYLLERLAFVEDVSAQRASRGPGVSVLEPAGMVGAVACMRRRGAERQRQRARRVKLKLQRCTCQRAAAQCTTHPSSTPGRLRPSPPRRTLWLPLLTRRAPPLAGRQPLSACRHSA